jgi:CRISPR-associated protein Cas5d
MSRSLEVGFEVAGAAAMFARPDTGSTPISYPVPTYSAAKAMFEAVARLKSAYVHPTRVEVCKRIRYDRFVTNYGGPLRKPDQINKNNNYQLIATILVDVCYRIYGEVRGKQSTRGGKDARMKPRSGRTDHCEKLRDLFNKRLHMGQAFYTPCLGWKEFVPSYFGAFRDRDEHGGKVQRDRSVSLVIPSLLLSMWENQQLKPTFGPEWEIVEGLMSYEKRRPDHVE